MPTVGEVIRTRRKSMGLTLKQLADLLDVERSAVNQWELNKTSPKTARIPKISEVMGIPREDLIADTNDTGSRLHTNNGGEQNLLFGGRANQPGKGPLTGHGKEVTVTQRKVGDSSLDVYGTSAEGADTMALSAKPIGSAPRPESAEMNNEAFQIEVATNDMFPRYEIGDEILVLPGKTLVPGRDVLILDGDGANGKPRRCKLRRLIKATDDHWICKLWNPAGEETLSRKEWPIAYATELVRHR